MPMKTVQIRLTKEQLNMIDEKVKQGKYPSRSEAIRDYLRKVELFELFNRFFEITERAPISEEDLERARERVWKEKFERRLKQEGSTSS